MQNLTLMRTQVSRRIQKGDSTYLTKITDWLNTRYEDVQRRFPWPQLVKTTTITTTAGVPTVVIPRDVRLILDLFDPTNDVHMTSADSQFVGRAMTDVIDVQGLPMTYVQEEDTVLAQPSSTSVLTLSSSAAGDSTQTVRVWGISNGNEITEAVTLTGTTGVSTVNSYTRIDRLAKSATTTGIITVTSNSATVTIAVMPAFEITARYTKLRFIRVPTSAVTYTLTYKTRTARLVNDEDIPIIECDQVLVIGAYAEALEEQRQFSKATLEWQKYENMLTLLWDEFERQRDYVPRFQPQVDATNRRRIDHPHLG